MRRLFFTLLILLSFLPIHLGFAQNVRPISIPDANLRAKIEEALGKTAGARITTAEMKLLIELDAHRSNIRDLTGLEHAPNLVRLLLRGNDISDISPLSGLTQLTRLHLANNDISDISSLSGLTQLTNLYLANNAISDISPLAGLTTLEELSLYGNAISDVSPLTGLTTLEELLLSKNAISDISPLSGLTKLTNLDIANNDISDISSLLRFTDLEELSIGSNPIQDFSLLVRFSRLSHLRIGGDSVPDLSLLAGMTHLKSLWISYAPAVSDISPLAGLTTLEDLLLHGNAISDVSPLAGLTQLTSLNLGNNAISDISPLSGLTQLTLLYLHGNAISDISPLTGLTKLIILSLSGNAISDISPLTGLTQLRFLYLRDNPLSYAAIHTHIPAIQAKGSQVYFDNVAHPALVKISGDNQSGQPGSELADRLVVEVQDSTGKVIEGVPVTFEVTAGGGSFSAEATPLGTNEVSPIVDEKLLTTTGVTGPRGRISVGLTLGEKPGRNTVRVTVQGIASFVIFTAMGIPSQTTSPAPDTPDLVVEAVKAPPATVAPGETFRLSAILRNIGTGASTATIVRYYRSSDDTISTADTQIGSGKRDPLAANASLRRYLEVTAPTTPGTYYYGVCVEPVVDESDTTNNCSDPVRVTVRLREDINGDGVVDKTDVTLVVENLGQTGENSADVNDDGIVDIADFLLVVAAIDADAAAPSLHAAGLLGLSAAEVQHLLTQARQRSFTDPVYLRGIAVLERLLALLLPKETGLLANYPNPFNPETWIPYQLAEAAAVSVSIYTVDGQLVRTLDVGHQAAGYYTARGHAAYWDGKNRLGEPVASGVYFYVLTAGDFTATRKMLIRK